MDTEVIDIIVQQDRNINDICHGSLAFIIINEGTNDPSMVPKLPAVDQNPISPPFFSREK